MIFKDKICEFGDNLFIRNPARTKKAHNLFNMFGLVRWIKSGPKNTTAFDGSELDLTYISDRVIAMAYPATGFEKTYRNPIKDVSKFFRKNHGTDFLIINVSNRQYNYNKFDQNVKDYFWPNHKAPPLTTLFIICQDVHEFLKSIFKLIKGN